MRHVDMNDKKEQDDFVEKATEWFNAKPNSVTFGNVNQAGAYFAMRWGYGGDCMLVFKLDPDFEPTVYDEVLDRLEGYWIN